MNKLKRLLRNKNGDVGVLPVLVFVIILAIGGLLNEIIRVVAVHDQISVEMNRAINLCIKTSVYDSYRIDKVNYYLDPIKAEEAFYDYLYDDMKLNYSMTKYTDEGELMYTVYIDQLNIDSMNAKASVEGTVYVPGFFDIGTFPLRYKVQSRNMRIDELAL
jgi:hypothetical protein